MTWIEDLEQELAGHPEVRLAVLFGSSARRGEGRDADVAVLLEPDAVEQRRALESALHRAVGRPVDLIHLRDAPPLLRFEIARDGRVLVERAPYLWADERARAMRDWWDWAPQARALFAAAARRVREKVTRGPA